MLSPRVPDLIGLQLLLAVQTTGSLAAGGAAIGMTQQGASLRMKAMETQIGLPLLLRSSHGSSLTAAGALVAQWAAPVLASADRLDAGIGSLRNTRNAHLRIAASLTVAEHLAPRWFLALRAAQQRSGAHITDLELTTANSGAVVKAVIDGSADVGFIEAPGAPRAVRSKVVDHDHLVLVAAPGHPWARPGRQVSVEEVARTALVSRERGSGTRDAFVRGLRAALPGGTELAVPVMELATAAAVRAAIAAGAAPGAISALAVADDLALGRLVEVPVPGLDLRRKLRAVWRSSSQPPPGPARDLVAIALWSGRAGRSAGKAAHLPGSAS